MGILSPFLFLAVADPLKSPSGARVHKVSDCDCFCLCGSVPCRPGDVSIVCVDRTNVCVHPCMYVSTGACTHTRMHVCIHARMCTYIHIHVYISISVYIYIYYIHIYISYINIYMSYISTYMNVCMHARMCAFMPVCVHACTKISICIYIYSTLGVHSTTASLITHTSPCAHGRQAGAARGR